MRENSDYSPFMALSKYDKLNDATLTKFKIIVESKLKEINSDFIDKKIEMYVESEKKIYDLLDTVPNIEKYQRHENIKTGIFSTRALFSSDHPQHLELDIVNKARNYCELVKSHNQLSEEIVIFCKQNEIYSYEFHERGIHRYNNGINWPSSSMTMFLQRTGNFGLYAYESDYLNPQAFDSKVSDLCSNSQRLSKKILDLFYQGEFRSTNHDTRKHGYGVTFLKLSIEKEKLNSSISETIEQLEKKIRKIELVQRTRKKQKDKSDNNGFIYVMSNKAYPGIYKIGSTYGLPEERAEELTGTGHLHPFKVEMSYQIKDAEYYEKSVHKILEKNRVNKNREFFDIDIRLLKEVLAKLSDKVGRTDNRIKIDEIRKLINE